MYRELCLSEEVAVDEVAPAHFGVKGVEAELKQKSWTDVLLLLQRPSHDIFRFVAHDALETHDEVGRKKAARIFHDLILLHS